MHDKHSARPAEELFLKTISQLKGNSIALDLGANVGKISIILAKKAGKVYAFEPDPWAFQQLKNNISRYKNAHPIQAAAGTTDELITMYRKTNYENNPAVASQATSIYKNKSNVDPHNKIEVQQIDVIRFMLDLDRDIDIIKMDIEGAEVPILESLLNSSIAERIHYIFVETHEFKVPGLLERTDALRKKISKMKRPMIYLNWH